MAADERPAGRDALVVPPRTAVELGEGECWRLLASVSLGRVVFTMRAMPAIRPVNHLVDGKTVVIRSHLGAAIAAHAAGAEGGVVCYEADELDPVGHTGWSVVVTGLARLVGDAAARARYERLLEPWAAGRMDYVIAIEPQSRHMAGTPPWIRPGGASSAGRHGSQDAKELAAV